MAGTLKLELAQFREVERFSKLGFSLDEATKGLLNKGFRLTQLLVQNRNLPFSIDKQILGLYPSLNAFIDWMPLEFLSLYEYHFLTYYLGSIFFYPLNRYLSVKSAEIDTIIFNYLFWHFTDKFIQFIEKNYNFRG